MSFISVLDIASGCTAVLVLLLLIRLLWYKNKPWHMPKWFIMVYQITFFVILSYWLTITLWWLT